MNLPNELVIMILKHLSFRERITVEEILGYREHVGRLKNEGPPNLCFVLERKVCGPPAPVNLDILEPPAKYYQTLTVLEDSIYGEKDFVCYGTKDNVTWEAVDDNDWEPINLNYGVYLDVYGVNYSIYY